MCMAGHPGGLLFWESPEAIDWSLGTVYIATLALFGSLHDPSEGPSPTETV